MPGREHGGVGTRLNAAQRVAAGVPAIAPAGHSGVEIEPLVGGQREPGSLQLPRVGDWQGAALVGTGLGEQEEDEAAGEEAGADEGRDAQGMAAVAGELVQQRRHVGVAIFGLRREAALQRRAEPLGKFAGEPRRLRGGFGGQALAGGGRGAERGCAGDSLVERDAEAELIAAGIEVAAEELFGRGVAVGAEARLVVGALADGGGEAEVEDLDAAVGVDDRVLRLEVAVHEPGGVDRLEAAAGLDVAGQDLAPGRSRGAVAALHPFAEVGAVDQLHGDPRLAHEEARGVDADDVVAADPRERLGLALQLGFVAGRRGSALQQLERDRYGEDRVFSGEHHAHAAAAELLADDVAIDGDRLGLTEHRGGEAAAMEGGEQGVGGVGRGPREGATQGLPVARVVVGGRALHGPGSRGGVDVAELAGPVAQVGKPHDELLGVADGDGGVLAVSGDEGAEALLGEADAVADLGEAHVHHGRDLAGAEVFPHVELERELLLERQLAQGSVEQLGVDAVVDLGGEGAGGRGGAELLEVEVGLAVAAAQALAELAVGDALQVPAEAFGLADLVALLDDDAKGVVDDLGRELAVADPPTHGGEQGLVVAARQGVAGAPVTLAPQRQQLRVRARLVLLRGAHDRVDPD